jgi:hypothetical protein
MQLYKERSASLSFVNFDESEIEISEDIRITKNEDEWISISI